MTAADHKWRPVIWACLMAATYILNTRLLTWPADRFLGMTLSPASSLSGLGTSVCELMLLSLVGIGLTVGLHVTSLCAAAFLAGVPVNVDLFIASSSSLLVAIGGIWLMRRYHLPWWSLWVIAWLTSGWQTVVVFALLGTPWLAAGGLAVKAHLCFYGALGAYLARSGIRRAHPGATE